MIHWTISRINQISISDKWELGAEKPFHPRRISLRCPQVQDMQVVAYGPELHMIREHFQNIRMVQGDQVVWYGEDACFILNNMPESKDYNWNDFHQRHRFTEALRKFFPTSVSINDTPETRIKVWEAYEENRRQFATWLEPGMIVDLDMCGGQWPKMERVLRRIFRYADGKR